MAVKEYVCKTPFCTEYGVAFEIMLGVNAPDPKCPECLVVTEQLPSRFATPWTGTLDRYNKAGCETLNGCKGGHIQWRIRSSRLADGSAEPVRITNRQEQREFCRAEGLVDPTDVNPNLEGNSDGVWQNTSGFSGQWASTPSYLAQEPQAATWRIAVDGVARKQS